MASSATRSESALAAPYVPRLLLDWHEEEPRHRQVNGSLVSADISGFTALSERLAAYGREGAEELTLLLNRCFGPMIEIVDAHGGDVLKFGGDALLILFTGQDHTRRAAGACHQMRQLVERTWSTPLVKKVELGISQGIHSGTFDIHLVDAGHQELLVVGPGMTNTVECEGAAQRGEILLSHAAAELLDSDLLGPSTENGRPLVANPGDPGDYVWPDNEINVSCAIDPFVPDWLLEQVNAGRVAEHRVVSVAFVFFGGLDDAFAASGAAEAHELLEQLATVTREAVERHDVYWLASDVYPGGGKLILTAGAPKSTGQDEDALSRTIRTILDQSIGLPLRAGVNRGAVYMGDLGSERRRTFTVMGDTVNLAARLMQKSGPGQMVASQGVIDALHAEVEGETLEPFLVKGKTKPIHAVMVDAIAEAPTSTEPGEQTVRFVGRGTELSTLQNLLSSAEAGHGAVMDLVGEPGIGKSRLVEELLKQNPHTSTVRVSGGLYSRSSPYLAIRTLLRDLAGCHQELAADEAGELLSAWVEKLDASLLPWLPLIAVPFDAKVAQTPEVDRIDPSNRAVKLREVVVDLLETLLPSTTVLQIEDAHWLDKASTELFAALNHRIAALPWLLIALRRADTESFASRSPESHQLHLGAMTSNDTRELALAAIGVGLGSEPDDVDDLIDRGVTNPLFLLELVRSGPGVATPDSIEALVTARIDTLDATNRLLLRECSVLGAVIDTKLLGEATGKAALDSSDSWAPLSGFLSHERDGIYRFQHALYRQVAYDGLSFRRRQQLHAAVGTALEQRSSDAPEAFSELLSVHFHFAKDWARSWRYSAIAGDRARAKYANVAAADFYQRAIDSSRRHRVPRTELAVLAESLSDVCELAARYDQADGAITIARGASDDPEAKARLIRKAGTLRVRQGRFTQGLRWYGRGLKIASELADDAERHAEVGHFCLAYAGARFRQGKSRECVSWAHRAESEAQQIDDSAMLAHAYYLIGIGHNVQRGSEAADYLHRSLSLFEREEDLLGQANVLNNLGVDAKDGGRWKEAIELYEQSREARRLIGDVVGAATASNNIAEILSDQGHFEQAEPLLEDALKIWRRADFSIGIAIATSYLGRLYARRGQYDDAERLLADALGQFDQIGAAHYVLETQIFELERRLLAGQRDLIGEAEELIEIATTSDDLLLHNMMLRFKAWMLKQDGQHTAAETVVNAAIVADEQSHTPFELALALIVRGQILQATGGDRQADHQSARSMLNQLGVVSLPSIHPPH